MSEELIDRGREHLTRGRWDDAAGVFEVVLSEQPDNPVALAGLGDAYFWTGRTLEGLRFRERAFAAYKRQGDVFWAAESAVWLCLVQASAMGNIAASKGWLARAASTLEGVDAGPALGWLWICEAAHCADPASARVLLDKALEQARQAGDVDLELCTLSELGVVLVKLGQVEEGLRRIDEAMAGVLAGEQSYFDTVVFTSCAMLNACDMVADVARAAQWVQAADDFGQTFGGFYLYAFCRTVYGRLLIVKGRWQEAEDEIKNAMAAARGVYPAMYRRAQAHLADLRLRQGRLKEVEVLLGQIDSPVAGALVAAALALQRSTPEVAIDLVQRWLDSEDELVEASLHSGGRGASFDMSVALGLLVRACLAAGRTEDAAMAVARLGERAVQDGAGLARASYALARGLLFAATGQEEAVRSLETAVEGFAELDLPYEAAQARMELARLLRETNRELAVIEARNAAGVFEKLGASHDVDVAYALLRSLGAGGRTGLKQQAVLTQREQEILALIAQGLSNQEIAQRLYIAPKTASHHVSNLLSKLGVKNRAEAAAEYVQLSGASDR
jgi:DNA-binding NarL/FixJ family response regulator